MYQKRKNTEEGIPDHVRKHLRSQPSSGQSIRHYCQQHSLSTWSFYQWRKRYQSKLGIVKDSRYSFTEVGVLTQSATICDIRFPTGVSLSVHRGVSQTEIAAIIELFTSDSNPC